MIFRNERDTDIELVGVLASHDDVNPAGWGDKKEVFINRNGDIQYQVKAISENAPKRLFTGYINSIRNNEDLDTTDINQDNETRIEKFKATVEPSLFLFTRYTSYGLSGEEYNKVSEAILIPRPIQIDSTSVMVAIPVYSPKDVTQKWEFEKHLKLYRTYDTFDEFIELIKTKNPIGNVVHYEGRDEYPRFIVWYGEEKFSAIGPFIGVSKTQFGMLVQYKELYEIDISDSADYVIHNEINPSILHMNEKTYELILNSLLKKEGNLLLVSETLTEKAENEHVIDTLNEQNNINSEANETGSEESGEEPKVLNTNIKDERLFLQLLKYNCENRRLFYDSKDLANFHTAMKTGSLVILAGMSGTGKSALVEVYARALGITNSDKEHFLSIPVRPAWNDDSDLLGYVDLIHRVYRPSDTGFIKCLVEASRHQEELYIICLDEMNLARVEHYFSQFLSILEKPNGQRSLRLYDEQYTGSLYNAADYPPTIDIHENVKFVGTVNIDESTYHFADKVLDRANVINLKVLDYTKLWRPSPYSFANRVEWSSDEYAKLLKNESPELPEVRKFLWELHMLLNKVNDSLGVSPRVVVSIERYLNNRPDEQNEFELTMDNALDYQIKQRVLTKLRGPEEQFGTLLSDIDSKDSIVALLEQYNNLSTFTMCKQVLEQKKREIGIYGYCL